MLLTPRKDERKIERELQTNYPHAIIETIDLHRGDAYETVAEFPSFGVSAIARSAAQSKLNLKQKLEKIFTPEN